MSNNQLAFDTIVAFMKVQGRPSMDRYSCRFRGQDNTKCAVGVLIPDFVYSPMMEDRIDNTNRLVAETYNLDRDFLEALQNAHDDYDDDFDPSWLSCFLRRAKDVAEEYELDPSSCLTS